jgi:hypothetical protein
LKIQISFELLLVLNQYFRSHNCALCITHSNAPNTLWYISYFYIYNIEQKRHTSFNFQNFTNEECQFLFSSYIWFHSLCAVFHYSSIIKTSPSIFFYVIHFRQTIKQKLLAYGKFDSSSAGTAPFAPVGWVYMDKFLISSSRTTI